MARWMNPIKKDRAFIIAEAGVNHNGRLDLALELVDLAAEAGTDAIKFQTFVPELGVSKYADMATYQKKNLGRKGSQLEMVRKLKLDHKEFLMVKKRCDSRGILFLSTPFDYISVDFLDPIIPLYKIPSGEITNFPFLRYIAGKGKPIILSTGMSSLHEVDEAITTIRETDKDLPLYLLHCTSNYPTAFSEVNLMAMQTMGSAFKLPVGYSDHTLGIEVPIAAVALGAVIIEKHFTSDRSLEGPDHKSSLEPMELAQMVKAIRNVEKALGDGIKRPSKNEIAIRCVARKSLIAARDMNAGTVVKAKDIFIKRPGDGIPPKFLDIIRDKVLCRDIKEDEKFTWSHFLMGDRATEIKGRRRSRPRKDKKGA